MVSDLIFSKLEREMQAVRLDLIEGDDFLKLCDDHPKIGYIVVTNIALILSDYLRKTNDDVIKLTTALSLALSG